MFHIKTLCKSIDNVTLLQLKCRRFLLWTNWSNFANETILFANESAIIQSMSNKRIDI